MNLLHKLSMGLCAATLAGASLTSASPLQDGDIPDTLGGLPVDKVSTRAVLEHTTGPQFLSPWAAAIPDHPTIPSPRDFLGHIAGAPGEITSVDEIHAYFRAIATSTDRATVVSIGKTAEGREMITMFIADADLLATLDETVGNLNALSDPRSLNAEAANALIKSTKPIYYVSAGLHSPEYGPPEASMEIAYRLAAEERDVYKNIRKNVITMLTPVLEVDGRNRSTEWFHKISKGYTDYANRPPSGPPFWGHYTFHDNNRDGLTMTQPLTKNFTNTIMKYKPTSYIDLHESVAYLYISTGTGPYNPSASSTIIGEWQTQANWEVTRLTSMGMPGVWTWGFGNAWYPGYMEWIPNNRNMSGRFYETFSNNSAETMMRDLSDQKINGDPITKKTWYRPFPPSAETLWSMRNNTNYMVTGVTAALEFAANNGEVMVGNFYKKSAEAIEIGKRPENSAPNAIVIPAAQRDAGSARAVLDLVVEQGIELSIANKAGTYGDVKIAKGDAIIKLNQPYGPYARMLFENQSFPEDFKLPPYDDVAWTFGLARGVDVKMVGNVAVLDHPTDRITAGKAVYQTPSLKSAKNYAVAHRGQEGLGELRFALPAAKMVSAKAAVKIGKTTYPAGTIFIDASSVSKAELDQVVENTLLKVDGLSRLPKGEMIDLDVPRVALLHSWISTQDPGWVRYTFDQARVPYTILEKTELKAGKLRDKYDVIIAPEFGYRGTLKALINGVDKKWSPLPYETTAETPSHGKIVSSPDITGGYGFEGLQALKDFMNDGGTFLGIASGGSLAVDSGIVSDVSMSRPNVNTPTSFITVKINDKTSPLTFGYDEITHAFRGNTPFYKVGKDDRDLVVAQFGTKQASVRPWLEEEGEKAPESEAPLVLSGGVLSGKSELDGAAAVIETTVGKGQAVFFAWNPLRRHLNHHDHAFVYNAMMYWNDLH